MNCNNKSSSTCFEYFKSLVLSLKRDISKFNSDHNSLSPDSKYSFFIKSDLHSRRVSLFNDLVLYKSYLGDYYSRLHFYAKKSLLQSYERF